jgi:hypothetical protein
MRKLPVSVSEAVTAVKLAVGWWGLRARSATELSVASL